MAPALTESRPPPAAWFLALPATLLTVAVLILPLALMFRYSLNRYSPSELMIEAVTAENYARFFSDVFYQGVLGTTVWVSALTTLLCLVFGLPAAYYIARAPAHIKGMLIILVVLPLLMGNAVRTASWMVVLGKTGVVNAALLWTGLVDEALTILYTPTAVVIGLTSVLLPFMIITLQSVIDGIDRALEEASLNLGAGPVTTFFKVIVPLALPGIVAGSVLCFTLSMNAYATPVLIGGPQFHMMGPTIYGQITKVANWPFGAALAFVLMGATLALTLISTAALQRRWRR
jgi:putative spermidine/putrescine transport system permease protein